MRLLSLSFLLIPICLLCFGCGFRPVDADVSFPTEKISAVPESPAFLNIPPEQIGYMLYDLETKAVVRSHNRSRGFIPASVTKVATAVAALDALGPAHRFETSLAYKGSISGNTLTGDLYIKGTGDPLLTATDLMEMIDRMKEHEISAVTGRFFYDESELKSVRQIDPDMEPDVSFNCGVSALSLEYNAITADWKRDRKSRSLELFLTPSLPVNRTALSAAKLRENITFSYQSAGGVETWLLSPDEDRDGRDRLPVKDAASYTAHLFSALCAMRGIRLPKPEPGITPGNTSSLAVHTGRPLSELADITLTFSVNVMAELIMLGAAKELSGTAWPLDKSAREISRHLAGRLEKINWKDFLLVNGSGLTVRNRISPEQMAAILVYADAQNYNGKKFRDFLPASGWGWSLASRLNRPETAFHVWAKSGTINYAIGLAGYLYTKAHRTMAFVVFINDIEQRRAYDADPDRRSKASMRNVNAWQNNAKKAMDSIVESWILEL